MRTILAAMLLASAVSCRSTPPPAKTTEASETVKTEVPKKTTSPIDAGSLPNSLWKVDAKILDQLDLPVDVFGYTVRPPKGFKKVDHKTKTGAIELIWWESPARADFKRTYLILSSSVPPNPKDPKYAPEQLLADGLDVVKKFSDKWSQSGVEKGEINGISFVRRRFRAYFPLKEHSYYMRGILYATRDGDRIVQMGVREETTRAEDDFLNVAKNALLTFAKK